MKGPGACGVTGHDDVVTFTGSDVQRVTVVRLRQRPAILGEDLLLQTMQVHGVDQQSFIQITDANAITQLGQDGLRVGERFSVEGEPDASIIQRKGVLSIVFGIGGRVRRLDDESAKQSFGHLLSGIVMRVVNV